MITDVSHINIETQVTMVMLIKNKSSVEHIPRAQPRSCMLLDSCLYVLSTNMFVLSVYLHAQELEMHDQFCRKRRVLLL